MVSAGFCQNPHITTRFFVPTDLGESGQRQVPDFFALLREGPVVHFVNPILGLLVDARHLEQHVAEASGPGDVTV